MVVRVTENVWTMSQVRRKAIEIAYYSAGEGRCICLLPSTGRGAHDLFAVGRVLAQSGYKVLLPEPRGIGASRGAMSGLTLVDLAADVAAVIEAEATNAVVCGHAFGCWVARALAQNRQDLAEAIVFMAAGGKAWDPSLSRAIEVAMDHGQMKEARLAALKTAFFSDSGNPESWLDGWYPDVVAMQRGARAATDKGDWWTGGKAPILDIIAGDDPFRPPASHDDFAAEFGSRVSVSHIAGASHALPDERPEETAREIVAWIEAGH